MTEKDWAVGLTAPLGHTPQAEMLPVQLAWPPWSPNPPSRPKGRGMASGPREACPSRYAMIAGVGGFLYHPR